MSKDPGPFTPEQHRLRHVALHSSLDELVADFARHTGKLFSQATLLELMEWSHAQTISPTEAAG